LARAEVCTVGMLAPNELVATVQEQPIAAAVSRVPVVVLHVGEGETRRATARAGEQVGQAVRSIFKPSPPADERAVARPAAPGERRPRVT